MDSTVRPTEHPPKYETANALTHGLGILLSLAAVFVLMPVALKTNDPWLIGASALYLASLLGVYISSTLSHVFKDVKRRNIFRRLDQAFIYFLIAGTYTPISVAYLDGAWWWGLLALMWMLAIFGFASKFLFAHKLHDVDIWIYIFMGWLPAIGGMPFSPKIPFDCLAWFFGGGIFYTAGTYFLYKDTTAWYYHSIWHLLVIAGSATHFVIILKCVGN